MFLCIFTLPYSRCYVNLPNDNTMQSMLWLDHWMSPVDGRVRRSRELQMAINIVYNEIDSICCKGKVSATPIIWWPELTRLTLKQDRPRYVVNFGLFKLADDNYVLVNGLLSIWAHYHY